MHVWYCRRPEESGSSSEPLKLELQMLVKMVLGTKPRISESATSALNSVPDLSHFHKASVLWGYYGIGNLWNR